MKPIDCVIAFITVLVILLTCASLGGCDEVKDAQVTSDYTAEVIASAQRQAKLDKMQRHFNKTLLVGIK